MEPSNKPCPSVRRTVIVVTEVRRGFVVGKSGTTVAVYEAVRMVEVRDQ